jgi:hypothetical protein
MAKNDVNVGEKKIMDNNPTVAGVNLVNDLIGDDYKSRGYKVLIAIFAVILTACAVIFLAYGKIITGIIFLIISALLIATTVGFKVKRKKYQVDEKIINDVQPLFKD